MACGNEIVSRYGSDQTSQFFTSRYVYKLKREAISSKVSRFKARLIGQSFKMQQDVDYNDTFSSTPGSTTTRTIISLATAEDLELHSVDFTQACIQADRLPEGVNGRFFISLSPGSPHANTSGIVYEVLRPLYGVPSSPRALHKTLDSYFKGEGLRTRCLKNPCGIAPPMRNMLLML